MTPAGWQNSKQQTLLLFTEIPVNNTWTSVLFEKVKWLLNPGECETGHTEVNRKIHVTSSWYSLSLAQCHLIGKKISASVFSQGRKREIICPTFWHFRGLPKVIAPVSPSWNTNAIHYAYLNNWIYFYHSYFSNVVFVLVFMFILISPYLPSFGFFSPLVLFIPIFLLMRIKEESEKAGLKLNIQNLKSWHLVPSLHGKWKGEDWKQ